MQDPGGVSSAECRACPRRCGVCRAGGERGYCGAPDGLVIARAGLHFWEEPCISGERGSGAVFFSGCNLGCVFCQNHEISRGGRGRRVTEDELIDEMRRLCGEGAHNINLVTPSHYAFRLAGLLRRWKPPVPVVWNSSGYDSIEALRALEGLVDVYLPDMKYMSAAMASRYSGAPDYPVVAADAIREMQRQTGAPRFGPDGMLLSGTIVRHLVMPENIVNTLEVIDWVDEQFPNGEVLFSLMAQYTPMPDMPFPELRRRVSEDEYSLVLEHLDESGIENGYVQELSAAGEEFIPGFDLRSDSDNDGN